MSSERCTMFEGRCEHVQCMACPNDEYAKRVKKDYCAHFEGACEDVQCSQCLSVTATRNKYPGSMPKFTPHAGTQRTPLVEGFDYGQIPLRVGTPEPLEDIFLASAAEEMDVLAEDNRDEPDDVSHPHHYARWTMEPIEFIAINNLPWWLANVIKYTMRFDAKDGLQDLYKARSYLEMKIREQEGEKRFWDKPVQQERTLNDSDSRLR